MLDELEGMLRRYLPSVKIANVLKCRLQITSVIYTCSRNSEFLAPRFCRILIIKNRGKIKIPKKPPFDLVYLILEYKIMKLKPASVIVPFLNPHNDHIAVLEVIVNKITNSFPSMISFLKQVNL